MKKFFTLFFLISITFTFAADSNYNYYLSLKFCPSPLFIPQYSITVKRKLQEITISADNFQDKNFEKFMDTDDYIEMLNKLNKMSIWTIRTDIPVRRRNSFYEIEVFSKNRKNKYRVDIRNTYSTESANALKTARIIESYAEMYNPYNN